MAGEYGEPYRVGLSRILVVNRDGWGVADCMTSANWPDAEKHAARIVACVNACDGVSQEIAAQGPAAVATAILGRPENSTAAHEFAVELLGLTAGDIVTPTLLDELEALRTLDAGCADHPGYRAIHRPRVTGCPCCNQMWEARQMLIALRVAARKPAGIPTGR